MTTEAQKRARDKYNAKARQLIIRIYPSEPDILEKINEQQGGYARYIKRLIREDIARSKQNED